MGFRVIPAPTNSLIYLGLIDSTEKKTLNDFPAKSSFPLEKSFNICEEKNKLEEKQFFLLSFGSCTQKISAKKSI